jgi:dimeric dUTPase (all-alpha-NTP-PPase superfamily)
MSTSIKGIMQEVMDAQRNLDRTILRDHDLFNLQNQPDLMVNFDDNRKQALLVSYIHLRTAVKAIRKVGAKWWKNQNPMDEAELKMFINDLTNGEFFDVDIEVSNISMKIMAIVQELIELEDAIKENKPAPDIHDEFVDIIHFVVSLGLDLGINSEQQLKELYLKKNKTNHLRQESNY